ncbi:unnamed protein product, partial [Didymodactylos carnosus]
EAVVQRNQLEQMFLQKERENRRLTFENETLLYRLNNKYSATEYDCKTPTRESSLTTSLSLSHPRIKKTKLNSLPIHHSVDSELFRPTKKKDSSVFIFENNLENVDLMTKSLTVFDDEHENSSLSSMIRSLPPNSTLE